MRLRVAQRWCAGRQRWSRDDGRALDAGRYDVVALDHDPAAAFIERHHYTAALPSITHRFGLIDHASARGGRLVGVATLGVPMSRRVLTNPFPTLVPYEESLEFNRLVLLDEVPFNGESWFCARVFRAAAREGVRGVVTFADPVERLRRTGDRFELVKPGHVGIVYQALNMTYTGRGTRRSIWLLPDATVLTARSIAKVTGRERGHRGVIARLVALGAAAPVDDEDLCAWLASTLPAIGARRVHHPGNHRYVLRIGATRGQRTRTTIAMRAVSYPRTSGQLAIGVDRADAEDLSGLAA